MISSILSVLLLTAILVIVIVGLITNAREKRGKRISSLSEGCKDTNFHTLNYHVYGVLRRAVLTGMIIFLKDQTNLQIFLFNLHAIVFTGYLLFSRPLEDPK